MKKEYFLLIAVIAALSIYLVVQNTDKMAYELPQITGIEKKDITKIVIGKQNEAMTLTRSGSNWRVGDKQYAVDANKLENILSVLGTFGLTAMVSEAKNYERYDLTDEKKIHVQVWYDKDLKMEFDVGKTAATHQHTFVKISGDNRVYHARGNFRNNYDFTSEELRDKQVLKFDKTTIYKIQLNNKDQTLLLSLQTIDEKGTVTGSDKSGGDASTQPPDAKEITHQWKGKDGQDGNQAELDRLISQLSDLRCSRFNYDKTKDELKDPIYSIVLTGEQDYTISVFDKDKEEENEYTAISSASDEPFVLPKWQAEKIMVAFDLLLISSKE